MKGNSAKRGVKLTFVKLNSTKINADTNFRPVGILQDIIRGSTATEKLTSVMKYVRHLKAFFSSGDFDTSSGESLQGWHGDADRQDR